MRIFKWRLLSLCLFLSALCLADSAHTPPSAALQERTPTPQPKLKILIHKTDKTLKVLEDGKQIHEFNVVFGLSPEGNKERQGDMKTPEGVYYVRVKNAQSQFYLSLGLSYPERHDAQRALAAKLISKAQYKKIMEAHDKKQNPPSNTPLGGEIFIHGGGTWEGQNWTYGCIALDNADMKLLFHKIPHGTEVEIVP